MIVNGFTRQEVSELTRISVHRLQYLDRIGLIVGSRIGNSRKPVLLYSWNQILQLLYIRDSLKEVSDEELVGLIALLDAPVCYDAALVKIDAYYKGELMSRFCWMDFESQEYSFMKILQNVMDENFEPGTILNANEDIKLVNMRFFTPVREYVEDVLEIVRHSKSIDYQDFLYRSGLGNEPELGDLIAA